ncbi:MAG: 3-phosphoserine/phosphohydroxythreonine transaminase [Oligosphaeraceae bacterium]|nr:3-phosphoserine/phosphohydroxythreonine transaminase [Oligosphaeraceae bacterium]
MTVYNFNAGPAALPKPVLLQAQSEFVDYRGCGYGIIEESHRAPLFEEIIAAAEANVRRLLSISDDYEVLFLQGGASLQFAMIPMNIMLPGRKVGFCDTGEWSNKAMKEAKILGAEIDLLYDGAQVSYSRIDGVSAWSVPQDLAYLHICSNNTIYGTQYQEFPQSGAVPMVADMSSDIMSREVDVNRFGLIFAGAQKNIGPAGLTLVIVRKDLPERCPKTVPTMLRFATHVKSKSLFNTPPTFAIYILRLVTDWLLGNGGLAAMQRINDEKAALLYDFIDRSGFYRGTADPASRSRMNVCFRLPSEELEKQFVSAAKAAGLIGLKGHRAVGGCRASIYNAVPLEGVQRLLEVMADFQARC